VSEPVRGEEFKDDYRKALPKQLVQRLCRRSAWRASAAVLQDVFGSRRSHRARPAYWPNPLVVGLAVIIIGTRQHALFVMAHDAGALTCLYGLALLNDAVGRSCSMVQGLDVHLPCDPSPAPQQLYGELDPDTAAAWRLSARESLISSKNY